MSAEFTDYKDLSDARNDGMYENLMNYSALNQARIRVVDRKYMVSLDTYAVDTGKTIVSSKVINVYENSKAVAEYNRKVGNIEAVSPIYNNEGSVIAVLVVSLDISDIRVLAGDAFEGIYMIVFVVITFIIVCSIVLSYFYIRRYKKALKVVEDVDFGYIDKRVEVKGSTELKDFATHFNSIMDKNSELDSSRSEFVSNVSHELKTPITSIKVLADSLNMQEDVPVEVYKEFMEDIVSEIDRENKIIEDLLCMVRLDRASSTLNISSVNMNELLELVLKRLKPLAQKKNIEILFESFRPVVAQVDEVKLTQVISNLVENAIKYNNMDGWVHVSLNADHQFFYVRVEDSGIGIPKDSQGKVFERFYRVDKARSRETGGTGLGLSIVKNIILMHHGTIKLYSEEGMGTTFTFRIPLNYVEEDEK
jgi:signal transduction histidine kinase